MKPVYFLTRARDALSHLVTVELARLPEQPAVPRIVYLLKSEQGLRGFLNNDSTVRVSDYGYNQTPLVTSRQLMSSCNPPEYDNGDLAQISSLVCSFNKPRDVTALHKYKKNLSNNSSILILNSDKSYIDSMKRLLWKNQDQRPDLYQSISDFRTWSFRDFQSGVIGDGSLKIAKIPRDSNQESYQYDLSVHYQEVELLKALGQTKRLNPVYLKYSDFTIAQYEQMVVKTAIGSLTALHDCTNGELLKMAHTYQILSYIIDDCLRIISKNEPTWNSSSGIALSKERLVELSISFLRTTQGESTMLRRQVNIWNASDIMNTTGYFAYIARQKKVFAPHINMMNKILEDRIALAHSRGSRVSIGDDNIL